MAAAAVIIGRHRKNAGQPPMPKFDQVSQERQREALQDAKRKHALRRAMNTYDINKNG
eukprot:CAMPEP_0204340692 /NCGR_PEP_ID=MMETSP0469-20131031/22777_1 /ASSEMBLY_ACC=CAM_ASM_000384 /TAXON_ID=2969 /ORGANISM="Oxyrrhis marina" /LENGTH=57 /DNA_ID=CAMNT_0051325261 /DNA_START=1 /DNA_END=171 /DNA_ORIENTATION=+